MIKLYASGKNIEEIDVGVEGGITLFTDDPKELDWVEALCFEAHGEKDPFDFIYAALVDEGVLMGKTPGDSQAEWLAIFDFREPLVVQGSW